MTAGALVAALLVAVGQAPASSLPGTCTVTWDAGGFDDDWSTPQNWTGDQLPGPGAVACIPGSGFATVDGVFSVGALYVEAPANLNFLSGTALFVNGPTASVFEDGSFVSLDSAILGGAGKIEAAGSLDFNGHSILTSTDLPGGSAYAGTQGFLNVPSTGDLAVNGRLDLYTRYHLDVSGMMRVESAAFVSADWGTSMAIEPTGRFEINGDGGWYQGNAVAGETPAVIGNHGVIAKISGNNNASVIDADYRPAGAGHVAVDCCTTLAFSGQSLVAGSLQPDMSMGTAACGVQTTGICGGSSNPAIDPSSVTLDLDGANPATNAGVQELAAPPDTEDSRAVGHDVFAHADQLAGPVNPATLTMRFSQSDVMATPLDQVQVGHISDAGVMTQVPDCVGGTIPPGAAYCVVRPVFRDGLNTLVTVLTTETSRWRVRRTAAGDFDQTIPTAPQGLKAGLASPGDGSAVKLTWSAPADDGGAAPRYKIFRDGALLTTNNGETSAVVKNSGPGTHVFKVVAVNVIGAGPASGSVTIKLDKLSQPRRVTALQGAAGGALTAGAKWRPPADAGGYVIKKYKVAAFTAGGKLVVSKKVKANVRKLLLSLKAGRYVFKVRARNVDKWGPWSKPTAVVSPR